MKLFSKVFLRYAAERAIKTVAQAALALLVAGQSDIVSVDWLRVGGVAALAGLVSLLTSLAVATGGAPVEDPAPAGWAGPSAVPAPVAVEPVPVRPLDLTDNTQEFTAVTAE